MMSMVSAVRTINGPSTGQHARMRTMGKYAALPRAEQIAMDLFDGYTEITKSYDRLLDLEVYGSRFRYANTRITRMGHLRFVVESHLHEIYTLSERLISYLKLISRRLGKVRPEVDYRVGCERAERIVRESLRQIIDIRGSHVHRQGFSTFDLEQAEMFDLFRMHGSEPMDKLRGEYIYREARKKWLKAIHLNNRELAKLLDVYFEHLQPLLFNVDGTAFAHL
jgi:hypothetical protein